MVTQSERDRARYEERFKAELDARSMPCVMKATGRYEGDLIGRIHLCQKLLRQPQQSKEELYALPLVELERLAEVLEQQALSGLRPANGTNE